MTNPLDNARQIADIIDGAAPYAPKDDFVRQGSTGDGSSDDPARDDRPDAPPPEDDYGGYVEDMPPGGGKPSPVLAACALERQNDTGNARRFRLRYGDLARIDQAAVHVEAIGWFVWDEKRWKEDGDDRGIRPLAQRTAELIGHEAALIQPTPEEHQALNAAVSAAEKIEAIEADIEAIDGAGDKADEATRARRIKLIRDRAALVRIVGHGQAIEKRIQRRRSDRLRHANASGNKGKLDGMLNEARPFVSRRIREFDTGSLEVNIDNGVLFAAASEVEDEDCPDPDVRRTIRRWQVGIRGHDRKDWNTKLAPVFWCPEAKAPVFDAFLAEIMPNNDLRAYLRRWFGYCLTRLTGEQTFCIFHGEGSNGKSTLVDVVARILEDYATTVPISSLMADNARKGQEATPDLAKIPGARFVRTSEPKEGLALDEALIKELTGGEPINIRRLNQEFVEVYPEFKLVISCNRKPRILGNDDGIWRRISLVPFDVQIPKERRDKNLKDKLWAERSGILNWMVAGLLDYLARGRLDPPKEVVAATQEWRDDSDVLGAFVRAALEITRDPADRIETGQLYESFVIYSKRAGVTPIASTTFSRRLPKSANDFGFVKGKSDVSIYEGIRFKHGFDPSHTRYDHGRG